LGLSLLLPIFFIINYSFIFQYFLGSQHGQMYGCGRLYLPSTGTDDGLQAGRQACQDTKN